MLHFQCHFCNKNKEDLEKLNKIAHCAIRLLSPPYSRCDVFQDKEERKDWNNLSNALIDAGFTFEVFT